MESERKYIEELLNRFMDGETTLNEERLLGDWFRSHEVDDALLPYKQMFAAFDEGLPQNNAAPTRRRITWWQMAAAASIVALLMWGAMRLGTRPTQHPEPMPTVAKATTADTIGDTYNDNHAGNIMSMGDGTIEKIAKAGQTRQKSQPAHRATGKRSTAKPGARLTARDSIEVTRTEGALELAESEFLAEQIELEQQLEQLRRQRAAQQTGWHYTTLPCK